MWFHRIWCLTSSWCLLLTSALVSEQTGSGDVSGACGYQDVELVTRLQGTKLSYLAFRPSPSTVNGGQKMFEICGRTWQPSCLEG